MKKLIVLLFIMMFVGLAFGTRRAENWKPQNFTINTGSSQGITLNYGRTGLFIKNGSGTLNVVMTKESIVGTDNITPLERVNYYPNSWNPLSIDNITLNAQATTSVYIETYEVNE